MSVKSEKLQRILQYISEEGRICPQPHKWHELWEILPEKQRRSNGWDPPLPLILREWDNATDHQKILRLKCHVEYAEKKGILDEIEKFIISLKRHEWHTK